MRIEYKYEGQIVEFDVLTDDQIEVNATEMAKIFGKKTNDFLKLDSTKAFVEEMKKPFPAKRSDLKSLRFAGNADFESQEEDRSEDFRPLYRSEIGGSEGGGTWMKEVLALKFAAWLHPPFEVWVYRTIRAILRGEYEGGPTRQQRAMMRQEAELKAKANQLQK
ncbi:MAG: KilA-N domain-containing protein [Janthinobacterium lividum]